MELADIVGSIVRHWKVSVGILAASAVILAIFLVTRNEVLPETRYSAQVLVLIPAVDSDGIRPEGVPPVLLQGQQSLANLQSTHDEASDAAKLNEEERQDIEYSVAQNETFDIITLSASAREEGTAVAAANAYADTYIRARSRTVGDGARSRQRSLTNAISIYNKRLKAVEADLRARRVTLPTVDPTAASDEGDGTTTTPTTPAGASPEVAQLLNVRAILIASINGAEVNYAKAEIEALTPTSYATIVERPLPERITPPAPSPVLPTAIALGGGLLLALLVPVLMDRLDHTVRDAKTAATLLDAPVLTTIPAMRTSDHRLVPVGSAHDQAFRALAATSIATDRLPRAIVVTSPTGHAQTAVAANFAAALASLGLRVVLIATAADQAWFGADPSEPGGPSTFPELLDQAHRGVLDGEIERRLSTSTNANLVVIPPGSGADPSLPLDGLPPLLAALEAANVDITVIAGPSLLEDPNATIYAWATRSVLWAIESGDVTRASAQLAASRLVLAGVDPFGVAMVGSAT